MSCNKLTFWPGHCQYSGPKQANELTLCIKKLASTLKKSCVDPANRMTTKYTVPAKQNKVEKAKNQKIVPQVISQAVQDISLKNLLYHKLKNQLSR